MKEVETTTYEFQKYTGERIEDINEYVKAFMKDNPHTKILIGCDSQEHSRYIKYSVNIIMHRFDAAGIGHGGHAVFAPVIDKNKNMKSDIFTKLWSEVVHVVNVARLIGDIGVKPVIHLDYNSDENEYSNVLYSAGIGYAKAFGFEAYGKPDAWVASIVCDRVVKNKISRN